MAASFDHPARVPELSRSVPFSFGAADLRADNMSRRVHLSRQRITIDRSLQGIAMRLIVPVEAYQAVVVALKPAAQGGFFYEISLAHRDRELSVPLGETHDDAAVWRDWMAWASFFDRPALIERNQGLQAWVDEPVSSPIDSLCRMESAVLGPAFARKTKRRRRPGIVTRRSRNDGTAIVHREAELIART